MKNTTVAIKMLVIKISKIEATLVISKKNPYPKLGKCQLIKFSPK